MRARAASATPSRYAFHSARGAAKPTCGLCELVMQTFAAAYGSEAGVAALKWIPLGGLYIAGGLTPKNLSLLKGASGPFLQAFHDKGRVSPLLKKIPLYAVMAEDIGQRGAHLPGSSPGAGARRPCGRGPFLYMGKHTTKYSYVYNIILLGYFHNNS